MRSMHALARTPACTALELLLYSNCCRLQDNAGLLTNAEVLSVLRDREADQEPVVSKALPSEHKVGTLKFELAAAPVASHQRT